MALIRWSPSTDTVRFENDFDRIFDRSFFRTPVVNRGWTPAVDVNESNDGYRVYAELPGLERDDFKINYEDGIITIRGEKKFEKSDDTKEFHYTERSYGKFERSFRLPATVDADKIKATFKNGILILDLPKAEAAKPKEIRIQAA